MKTDVFSQREIETIVERAFDGEQVQLLDYHSDRYSEDEIGFLGIHQNLEITIKRHGKNEPEIQRFFVKRMPSLTETHLQFIREINVFDREAIYYNQILPLLKKSCPDTEEWSPKCLLASDQFVVLEDMSLRNYAMANKVMLNEKQLKAAFKAQARLHATSLVAEKQLGKPLNEVHPKYSEIFNEHAIKYKRLDHYVDLAEKIAERLGCDARRLRAGFRKSLDQVYDRSKLSTKLPKVLVHGDAWSNNYLFDATDPSKCVLVDFQWLRYGPPMCDPAQLIYLSTEREFRERTIGKAIEAYHQQFCEVLEKSDSEMKKPTLEDILAEYEELRSTALLYSVAYCPVIWLGQSTIDKYDEVERYMKLMLCPDSSFIMRIYDEDEAFAAKMNEVVEEAVEYFERRGVPIESNNGLQ